MPFIVYLGVTALFFLLLTASIAIMNRMGIQKIPMTWHLRFAVVAISLGLIHGILAMLSFI
jgi:hypothetical protein